LLKSKELKLLADLNKGSALSSEMSRHALGNRLVAFLHPREQLVHARKVFDLLVGEHVHDAGVFHLDDYLHVLLDQLVLQDLDDPGLRGGVEVVGGPAGLLVDPGLHPSDVDRRAVLLQELLALYLVELGGLVQELALEVLLVDPSAFDAEDHQHLEEDG